MKNCPPGTCSTIAIDISFWGFPGNLCSTRISMLSNFPWYPNMNDFWISVMSKYPWKPNIRDVQMSIISKYLSYPNIHHAQISIMSRYPSCLNIHNVQISMIFEYSKMWYPFTKIFHFPGSVIFCEVNFSGKSILTKDIHDVQIQKTMIPCQKWRIKWNRWQKRRRRVTCSRRPDSFTAGKNFYHF